MRKRFLVGKSWLALSAACLIFGTAAQLATRAAEGDPASPSEHTSAAGSVTSAQIANSTVRPKPLRILTIGAHPADVFDQSGGTMAHHAKRGDWVGCVVVTTGARVHDKVISDEMQRRKEIPGEEELKKTIAERSAVKEKEVVNACGILGVRESDIYFLRVDDLALLVNETHIRKLASLIRKLRPDVILTHYPYEDSALGSAHAITGQLVVHALGPAAGVDPGDTAPPHKVTQVFFFGQGAMGPRTHLWDAQGGASNNVFVDITDVADKKVACLDAMESQGYNGAYARKRIETTDGAFGTTIGVSYAEGFVSLYSTTNYYLPVSEIDRHHSSESDHETTRRKSFRISVP
jgi:LmbE family N-acetylglucosaminyl deacetylase